MRHYHDFDSSLNVENTQWNAIFSDLILRIMLMLDQSNMQVWRL